MLQAIRKSSKKFLIKVIIIIIIILFLLTGFDFFFNNKNDDKIIAKVNNYNIPLKELQLETNLHYQRLYNEFGENFKISLNEQKILKKYILNNLIEKYLLLDEVKKQNLYISEQMLDQKILKLPQFHIKGKFNVNLFNNIMNKYGYNYNKFRKKIKNEFLINQLSSAIINSAFITNSELLSLVNLYKQERNFSTCQVPSNQFIKNDVTNNEIKSFYEANKKDFISPEQVIVEYIELNKNNLSSNIKITKNDLKELYKKEITEISNKRTFSHILIKVDNNFNDIKAKNKIKQIIELLKHENNFESLEKIEKKNLNVETISPGMYDPVLEKVIFNLKLGEISPPIRRNDGYHLIKLIKIGNTIPPFNKMKPTLLIKIKKIMIDNYFFNMIQKLETLSYEISDINELSKAINVNVKTSKAFDRTGGLGIATTPKVVQEAFSHEVLHEGFNSKIIELDKDTVIVLHLKKHFKAHQKNLSQVFDVIRKHLINKKAINYITKHGANILANNPYSCNKFTGVTRDNKNINPKLLDIVFSIKHTPDCKPKFQGLLLNNEYVILKLEKVKYTTTISDEDYIKYRKLFTLNKGKQDFLYFINMLKTKATIKYY